MDPILVKLFVSILFLAFTAHSIQGANQCVRTNSEQSRHCTDECVYNDCRNSRKRCLCDGDCGYSCVYPRMRCPKPKKIRNGRIFFQSYRFNATQRAVCKHGFTLTGSLVRTCRGNGFWDGKQARCIKRCQDPGTPHKGSKKGKLRVGQTLRFSCDLCYQLRGSATRTCLPDLRWSGRQPTCTAVRCSTLQHPRNGKMTAYSRYCAGKPTEFMCYPGYQLTGPRRITCQNDGKWSAASPTCVHVTCSFLQNPTNGYLSSNSQQYDSIVQYHCDYGYQLNGSPSRRCQNSGTWTGDVPVCEIKRCQDPGTPHKGGKKGKLHVGQTLRFSCDQCYQLRGSAKRTCLPDLRWSGRQPTCIAVRCRTLRHPRNGRITAHSRYCAGKPTEFTCYSGYQLTGWRRITCQSDGKWSAASPTCVAVKANPTRAVLQPSKTPSTTSKLHTPTSSPTTTQVRTTTIALNSCAIPVLSPNARISFHGRNILLIRCKENYVTLAIGLKLCRGNKWTNLRELSCLVKTCFDPGFPKNGYKHGVSYVIGDVVTFTCDDCYRLIGHSKTTCLRHGSWSATRPMCVLKTCPSLKDTNEATVFHISQACNAVATYTCRDTRLTLVGSSKKICNKSGMWEGRAEPKCINPNFNIALGKPVSMSSHWKLLSGPASCAVDGNRYGIFLHTHYENRPWVKIDLLKEDIVSTVVVVNRQDCCNRRIDGFKVSVGNNGQKAEANTECGGRLKAMMGPNIIQCSRTLRGRYVFVYIKRHTIMALNEVEVYRRRMTE